MELLNDNRCDVNALLVLEHDLQVGVEPLKDLNWNRRIQNVTLCQVDKYHPIANVSFDFNRAHDVLKLGKDAVAQN